MPRASSRSSSRARDELAAGRLEQPPGGRRVERELALGEAELQRERDEPLLGAVVQVALEPAALEHRDVDEPRARALELLDAGAQLGLEALVLELQRGRRGRRAHEARVVAQRRVVDDRADELAVALDLGDGAPGARLGQLVALAVVGDVVPGRLAPVDELQRAVAERVGQRLAQTTCGGRAC